MEGALTPEPLIFTPMSTLTKQMSN